MHDDRRDLRRPVFRVRESGVKCVANDAFIDHDAVVEVAEDGLAGANILVTTATLFDVAARGDWGRQACGPQMAERKVTWIRPHWKGPVDAPLSAHATRISPRPR